MFGKFDVALCIRQCVSGKNVDNEVKIFLPKNRGSKNSLKNFAKEFEVLDYNKEVDFNE